MADTLDAMTSDRFYRKAPGFDAARSEIRAQSGTQFDPHIVDLFLRIPSATWINVRAAAESESVLWKRNRSAK
jgi:HD-GYP domain-containing protein (c-di-GMP phosphodiesterase class II)